MCTCMSMSWLEVAGIQRRTMTSTDPTFCFPGSFFMIIEEAPWIYRSADYRSAEISWNAGIAYSFHILMLSLPLLSSFFSFLHLDLYGLLPKTTASAESANGTSITQTSLSKNANRPSVVSLYLVVVCTTVEIVV